MTNPLPPTGPRAASSSAGWRPPAEHLPGSAGTIRLTGHLGSGCGRRWHVWEAVDEAHPEQQLVVEFVLKEHAPAIPPRQPDDRRYLLDLSPWQEAGWPVVAVVTVLPVRLPAPWSGIELLGFLGIGGMGQVWLARYCQESSGTRRHDELLAVKFLIDPHADLWPVERKQSVLVEQFLLEHDVGHDAATGSRFVVPIQPPLIELRSPAWPRWGLKMNYLTPSLADVIAFARRNSDGKRLPVEIVCGFLRNLTGALAELHHRGWVHHDLKPSNVLIERASDRGGNAWKAGFPESLRNARAVLSDLGAACRISETPLPLGQDLWKSPEQFQNPDDFPHKQIPGSHYLAHPAEDCYALGLLVRELCRPDVIETTDTGWLKNLADELTQDEPARRPAASYELILRLDPDWQAQAAVIRRELENGGGWRPDEHENFIGRKFVFEAFDAFRAECDQRQQGGVFLIVGPAGVGKTALLTEWTRRGAPHPAFYFRYRENRVLPGDMPRFLFRHLALRFQIPVSEPSDQEAGDRLKKLLDQIAREKLNPGGFLIIQVDALDESASRTTAAELIPIRTLPKGVFFIVSSRPSHGGVDHLKRFENQPSVCRFNLDDKSEDNLRDGADFLEDRLPGRFSRDQAERVARNAGGLFLLLQYWVEGLQAGRLQPQDVLERPAHWAKLDGSDRLIAWHQEQWKRINDELKSREDEDALDDFAALVAAIRGPVSEKQVQNWLDWRDRRLDWAQGLVAWLLHRFELDLDTGNKKICFLQARHQSVIDFLIHPELGPVRHDVGRMHGRIADFYRPKLTPNWSQVDPYGRHHLPRHLLLSAEFNDRAQELREAVEHLTNLRYHLTALGANGSSHAGTSQQS